MLQTTREGLASGFFSMIVTSGAMHEGQSAGRQPEGGRRRILMMARGSCVGVYPNGIGRVRASNR